MTRDQAKQILADCADRELTHLRIQLRYPTMFYQDRVKDRIERIQQAVKILLGDQHSKWWDMTRRKIAEKVVERVGG